MMKRVTPLLLLLACGDVTDPDGTPDEQEVITTVILTFEPTAGGDAIEAQWADPENDGDPTIDPITLDDGVEYALGVRFLNELESPPEELTEEITDEAEQHQVFFTGSGVEGPATGTNPAAVVSHAYADSDEGGLPIGLDNVVTALGVGSGELVVTLRHMPPEDGEPVKQADLAEAVASGGFAAIGGDNDAQVTFSIAVE